MPENKHEAVSPEEAKDINKRTRFWAQFVQICVMVCAIALLLLLVLYLLASSWKLWEIAALYGGVAIVSFIGLRIAASKRNKQH